MGEFYMSLVTPFNNYFYSLITPENQDELLNHCLNAKAVDQNIPWGSICVNEKEILELNGFIELLKPSIFRFLKELTPTPLEVELNEIWRNRYSKGCFQEIHHHNDFDISFVIFCDDYNETNAEFYFYNENSRYMNGKFRDLMMEPESLFMDDCWFLKPKKGQIVFFPSYFLHGVSVHKNEYVRTTVSGNMFIDKA